jgi:hypothetical protein
MQFIASSEKTHTYASIPFIDGQRARCLPCGFQDGYSPLRYRNGDCRLAANAIRVVTSRRDIQGSAVMKYISVFTVLSSCLILLKGVDT